MENVIYLRVPFSEKLRGRESKLFLKQACRDWLPPEVLSGPKKGFNVPLARWMAGGLDGYFDRFLGRARVDGQGFFVWSRLQELRAEHHRGRRDNSSELFSIIMFDAWHRRYVEGEDTPGAIEAGSLSA